MLVRDQKRLRQNVRQSLGVSSDPAPTVVQTLRAADALASLLRGTSGKYRLHLEVNGQPIGIGEAIVAETRRS